ncbi:MAG: type IV toxin-antitoxin system AbiEi family antitoxin domain-containing protein [Actinomycetota bacterium]
MDATSADDAFLRLAETQRGLLTSAQALAAGISRGALRWRRESNRWCELLPGVYALTEAEDPWLQKLEAARLWTGDGIVVGRSSAALWGLDGIPAGSVEIATATRKRHPRVTVHHKTSFASEDLVRHRGFLVTTPTRTLIDLSAVLDEALLTGALDSALRLGLTFTPLLRSRLALLGTKGRHGTAILQNVLREREIASGQTESPLEIKVERSLRRHGLDPPERQYTVTCPDGTRVRLDFAWPEQKVGIEADGFRWHADFESWQRDARKHNLLQEMGWKIVRATDRSVRETPDALPRQVIGLLGQARLTLGA